MGGARVWSEGGARYGVRVDRGCREWVVRHRAVGQHSPVGRLEYNGRLEYTGMIEYGRVHLSPAGRAAMTVAPAAAVGPEIPVAARAERAATAAPAEASHLQRLFPPPRWRRGICEGGQISAIY